MKHVGPIALVGDADMNNLELSVFCVVELRFDK